MCITINLNGPPLKLLFIIDRDLVILNIETLSLQLKLNRWSASEIFIYER